MWHIIFSLKTLNLVTRTMTSGKTHNVSQITTPGCRWSIFPDTTSPTWGGGVGTALRDKWLRIPRGYVISRMIGRGGVSAIYYPDLTQYTCGSKKSTHNRDMAIYSSDKLTGGENPGLRFLHYELMRDFSTNLLLFTLCLL